METLTVYPSEHQGPDFEHGGSLKRIPPNRLSETWELRGYINTILYNLNILTSGGSPLVVLIRQQLMALPEVTYFDFNHYKYTKHNNETHTVVGAVIPAQVTIIVTPGWIPLPSTHITVCVSNKQYANKLHLLGMAEDAEDILNDSMQSLAVEGKRLQLQIHYIFPTYWSTWSKYCVQTTPNYHFQLFRAISSANQNTTSFGGC